MPAHRTVTRELLLSRTRRTDTGCLEWTGSRTSAGYGQLSRDGYPTLAHRAMVEIEARLSKGKTVMHTCDNPPCINPAHLVVGDQAGNVRDMLMKRRDGRATLPASRWPRGSAVMTAKLAEADVPRIRALLLERVPHRRIAAMFGVSRRAISMIAHGQSWRHVP